MSEKITDEIKVRAVKVKDYVSSDAVAEYIRQHPDCYMYSGSYKDKLRQALDEGYLEVCIELFDIAADCTTSEQSGKEKLLSAQLKLKERREVEKDEDIEAYIKKVMGFLHSPPLNYGLALDVSKLQPSEAITLLRKLALCPSRQYYDLKNMSLLIKHGVDWVSVLKQLRSSRSIELLLSAVDDAKKLDTSRIPELMLHSAHNFAIAFDSPAMAVFRKCRGFIDDVMLEMLKTVSLTDISQDEVIRHYLALYTHKQTETGRVDLIALASLIRTNEFDKVRKLMMLGADASIKYKMVEALLCTKEVTAKQLDFFISLNEQSSYEQLAKEYFAVLHDYKGLNDKAKKNIPIIAMQLTPEKMFELIFEARKISQLRSEVSTVNLINLLLDLHITPPPDTMAFTWAVAEGEKTIVARFIEHGCKSYMPDPAGKQPVQLATDPEIAQMLLRQGGEALTASQMKDNTPLITRVICYLYHNKFEDRGEDISQEFLKDQLLAMPSPTDDKVRAEIKKYLAYESPYVRVVSDPTKQPNQEARLKNLQGLLEFIYSDDKDKKATISFAKDYKGHGYFSSTATTTSTAATTSTTATVTSTDSSTYVVR